MNYLKANNRSGYIAYDSTKEVAIILEVHSDNTEITSLQKTSYRKNFDEYNLTKHYSTCSELEFVQSLTWAIADVNNCYNKNSETL